MLKRLRTYLRNQSSKIIISSLLVSVGALSSQNVSLIKRDFCSADQDDSAINLTEDNFEANVFKCLEVKKCYFFGDPRKVYQKFKQTGDVFDIELLLLFLKLKANELETRQEYKSSLKAILDDYYPPDDREFEEAGYYFNINDFEKSLDLYLDIDRKAALNPNLSPAPKLNVANVYYEMNRPLEARLYYEAALYDSQLKELEPGDRKDFISYINRHISEINEGLGWP